MIRLCCDISFSKSFHKLNDLLYIISFFLEFDEQFLRFIVSLATPSSILNLLDKIRFLYPRHLSIKVELHLNLNKVHCKSNIHIVMSKFTALCMIQFHLMYANGKNQTTRTNFPQL